MSSDAQSASERHVSSPGLAIKQERGVSSPNVSWGDANLAEGGNQAASSGATSSVIASGSEGDLVAAKKARLNVTVTTRQQIAVATPRDYGTAYQPIVDYFYKRFMDQCKAAGGYDGMLAGWKVQLMRVTGAVTTSGMLDVVYESMKGRSFQSIVAAMMSMNLTPNSRSSKSMNRAQHALVAAECLEKALVSHALSVTGGRADDIRMDPRDSTKLTVVVRSEADQRAHWDALRQLGTVRVPTEEEITGLEAMHATGVATSASLRPVTTTEYVSCDDNCRFKFGQACTILNFGTIVSDSPAFHTPTQIFPLGFRCVRIEHDFSLNRTVECLCEILAISSDDAAQGKFHCAVSEWKLWDPSKNLPLFRITVGWQVGPEGSRKMIPKTYQALTQESVWAAAMTESFGLTEFDTKVLAEKDKIADSTGASDSDEKKQQAEVRRAYFAGLQKSGPRLAMDPRDAQCIIEDGVQRFVEGLPKAVDCAEYEFIAAREHDGGKKFALRAYAKVIEKSVRLARVVSGNVNAVSKPKPRKRDSAGNLVAGDSEDPLQSADKNGGGADGEAGAIAKSKAVKAAKAKVPREREVMPPLPPPITTSYNASVAYGEGGPRDSTGMNSERRSRAKDVDRLIRVHKEMFHARILKKRLHDAKEHTKTLCDLEEKQYLKKERELSELEKRSDGEKDTRGARPDPVQGLVRLYGPAFTQVLELWEFLTTYHKVFNLQEVPTLETLVSALKQCDPAFSAYQSGAVFPPAPSVSSTSLSQDPFQQSSHQIHPIAAAELLNKIGMVLTEMLRPEYERILGIDLAGNTMGGLNVPVNLLTWREIAKTVLVHGLSRESGYSETDAVSFAKGKGFVYVPDTGDKKILKLLRKRINWQRSISLDYQESLVGFKSGIIARIPTPSIRHPNAGLKWRELLLALVHIPHTCAWLVSETIESAYHACDGMDEANVNSVRARLAQCLCPDMVLIHDASKAKLAALAVLEIDTGTSVLEQPRVQASHDIAMAYIKECRANGGSAPAAPHIELSATYNPHALFPWDPSRYNNDTQRRLGTATTRTTLVDLNSEGIVGSIGVGLDQSKQASILGPDGEPVGSTTYFTGTTHVSIFGNDDDEDEDEGEESKSSQKKQQPWRFQVNYTDELDAKDAAAYERLSVASIRCLELVKTLMRNPQLAIFNWPIDSLSMPQYYAHIPQPLCLFDIRRHLVAGGYENNLTGFYCDVTIMFENAFSYNPENSQLNMLTQKAVLLFERLFFEQVIHWEYPLPAADCCHFCRSAEPVEASRCVICDRCEAFFHLHCVTPPLNRVPKGDWLCSYCVEQRSVSEVHPNKIAVVLNPAQPLQTGQVLAIDQDRKTLRFIVHFPDTDMREVWSGAKVRKYTLAYHARCKQAIMARDGLTEADYVKAKMTCPSSVAAARALVGDMAETMGRPTSEPANPRASLGELKECLNDWMPTMPSGYNIDDFDTVCGLARAYTGLHQTHYAVPCHMHDSHNFKARQKTLADPFFDRCRRAVATLSSAEDPHTPGALEWLSVLRSLMQRVAGSPPIIDLTAELEVQIPAAVDAGLLAIREGKANKSVLVRDCGIKQGNTIIQLPAENAKLGSGGSMASGPGTDQLKAEDLLGAEWDESSCRALVEKMIKQTADGDGSAATKASASSNMDVVPAVSDYASHHLIALLRKRRYGGPNRSERLTDNDARQVMWELKRMSRYRARDDALQLHGLLADIMNCVDLDCVRDVRPEDLVVAMASPMPARPVVTPSAEQNGAANALDALVAAAEERSEKPSTVATRAPPVPAGNEPPRSLYNLVSSIIVRQNVPKILDALDLEEWAECWDTSMIQYAQVGLSHLEASNIKPVLGPTLYPSRPEDSQAVKLRRQQDYHRLCAFCQQREAYLSSHFVCGQTWDEWAADIDCHSLAPVAEPGRDVGKDAKDCIGAYKLLVTTMQGSAASTVAILEPFLESARKRCQWVPADPQLRLREEQESANETSDSLHYRTFPPCKGSLLVHEVCMENMHKFREAALPRTIRRDVTRLMQLITRVGRGKTTALGSDRTGGRYWVFSGSPYLYVSSPPAHHTTQHLLAAMGSVSKDKQGNVVRAVSHALSSVEKNASIAEEDAESYVPGPSESFQEKYFVSSGFDIEGTTNGLGGLTWVVYRDEWDISRLMRWLDITDDEERNVFKTLEMLYPGAAKLAEKPTEEGAALISSLPKGEPYVTEASNTLHGAATESEADSSGEESGEDVMQTGNSSEAELQNSDSEDGHTGGAHVISSARRAARRATDMLQAQAREEQSRARARRQVIEAEETESEGENEQKDYTNGDAPGQDETKPIRVLHPDDEPKKRGRPQQLSKSLEYYTAPALSKDGRFTGCIVPLSKQLEFISYRLVEGQGSKRYGNAPKSFGVNDRVVVQNCVNGILWYANVLAVQYGSQPMYKVRYERWGPSYDEWVPPRRLAAPTDTARIGSRYRKARSVQRRSYAQYAQNEAWYFPEPLCQLRAAAVLEDMEVQGIEHLRIGFSDARADNPLGMLRCALLMVEAALPDQSKDENEDKWGKGPSFTRCWRESVAQAKDASDLIGPLMMLEFSLKTSWLKPTGLKLMACMPSRAVQCRRATLGLVAARLWALDATIRYEKNTDLEDSGKNIAEKFLRLERLTYGGRAAPFSSLEREETANSGNATAPIGDMDTDP